MTIAGAARTESSLIFVADSVAHAIDQANRRSVVRGRKIGWLAGWGGQLIFGHAGMYMSGEFLEPITARLARLGPDPQFDDVFEIFRDKVVPEWTMRALHSGHPQPAQFLIGGRDRKGVRLAAIERDTIYEPEPFQVVSIGGLRPDTEHPIPWGFPIDGVRGGVKLALLRLVEIHIQKQPSPFYGLPLYWITGFGRLGNHYGWYPDDAGVEE